MGFSSALFWNGVAILSCGAAVAASALGACAAGETSPDDASGNTSAAATTGTGNETPSGLPCEISKLIGERCATCHSDPPKQAAPNTMLTREHFLAPAKSDPSKTVAEYSIERMRATSFPMPPEGNLPEDQIAIFEAWVAAGLPAGDCSAPEPVVDPAFEGGLTCISGKHWPEGEDEYLSFDKEHMEPGESCNACHTEAQPGPIPGGDDDDGDDDDDDDDDDDGGPEMTIAGTVYPSGHDDRRCFGIPGPGLDDVRVVVTGADGVVHTFVPNETGNFFLEAEDGHVAKPYTAKVVSKKGERVMKIPASNVDCNACHTPEGANVEGDVLAPGRIVIPW